MDRSELIRLNEQLLQKRLAAGLPANKPSSTPKTKPHNPLLETYFEALEQGWQTGNRTEVITGDRARWDEFDRDRHPALKPALRIIADWYNNGIDQGHGLILYGNPGCGKTHLAEAIAQMYGYGAIFKVEPDFCKQIQATYNNGSQDTEAGIMQRIKAAKLLIFDDLGAYETKNSEWIQSLYFQIFDGRKEAEKAVMVTTNLPLKATVDKVVTSPLMDRLGGRVFSRLMGQVIPSTDKNYWVDLSAVEDQRLRGM